MLLVDVAANRSATLLDSPCTWWTLTSQSLLHISFIALMSCPLACLPSNLQALHDTPNFSVERGTRTKITIESQLELPCVVSDDSTTRCHTIVFSGHCCIDIDFAPPHKWWLPTNLPLLSLHNQMILIERLRHSFLSPSAMIRDVQYRVDIFVDTTTQGDFVSPFPYLPQGNTKHQPPVTI
ncbi:putative ribonuclease H protein [Senna tora]|uniref:Putative ribonuclease H protein n=1 Tax=Senna tora TaxID=362788 RepID=A0A834SG44_9FABA|nr:putative ribonuclease H protein [Senna tora]